LVDTRLGWARGKWTVDAQATNIARDRDAKAARTDFTSLPSFKGGRREGYARVAYGDSARGFWSQALVGVLRTNLQGIATTGDTVNKGSSLDTIRARTQQIVALGYRSDWWRASVTDRIRPLNGTSYHAPALRLGLGTDRYGLSVFGERRALDSITNYDITAIARPNSWLNLTASHAQRSPETATKRYATASTRAEAFVRVSRFWLSGGVAQEGLTSLTSPVLFGAPAATVSANASTGVVGSLRGRLYKSIMLDVQATHWGAAEYYRPRLDVRSELSVNTNWLSRFPKGEFGLNVRFVHESRDPVPFYWTSGGKTVARVTEPSQVVTGLLEIRIQSATLFYQYRNMTGQAYEQIPGLTMPPAVQMYGVRWEFWN
jgi:hypothetical protein